MTDRSLLQSKSLLETRAKLSESALKWDLFRIQCQGQSVGKRYRDSVNVSSPKDQQSLVTRASLRMENMPNGERKLGSLASQRLFGERSGLDSGGWTGSHVARDVTARASMGDTGLSTK